MSSTSINKEGPNSSASCSGIPHEDQKIATIPATIPTTETAPCGVPEKRQVVCTSCQHLYANSEVVLSPAILCHGHKDVDDTPRETHSAQPCSPLKTWQARRYDGLCGCAEAGYACNCNKGNQHSLKQVLQVSTGTCWGPRIKRTLLVIAAIIPFVFLIIYLVFIYS